MSSFEWTYVIRRIVRSPAYALVIVLSLSLGLAAVMATFGLVDSLLFRVPPGVQQPGSVVGIGTWTGPHRLSYPDYVDFGSQLDLMQSIGVFATIDYTVRVDGRPTDVRALLASASLAEVLGAPVRAGRWFDASEDRSGAQPVAVVSRHFLRTAFGDQGTLNAHFVLAGRTYTVVGVVEAAVAPDMTPADVVLPITNTPAFGGAEALASRDYRWLRVVGRLRPGVTLQMASEQATAVFREMNRGVRAVNQSTLERQMIAVSPIVGARVDPNSASVEVAGWLIALASVLLLMVCANVTSLSLARDISERRLQAIHTALGASPARLTARAVADIALLVALAGAGALSLTPIVQELLIGQVLGNSVPLPSLDVRAITVMLVLVMFAIVVCATPTALRSRHADVRQDLAASTGSNSRRQRHMFQAILCCQIAFGVLLVTEAALFVRSLRQASTVPLGIDLDRLLTVSADLKSAGVAGDSGVALARRLLAELRAVPGIQSVGFTNAAALPGYITHSIYSGDASSKLAASVSGVVGDYFPALGMSVVKGRAIKESDVESHARVVVVNEALVAAISPGADPLGKCVALTDSDPCNVVIGVVANRRASPEDVRPQPEVFLPLVEGPVPSQILRSLPGREIEIRTVTEPALLERHVRQIVASLVPGLTAIQVRTGRQYVAREFQAWRLGANVLTSFGLLAVLLASIGMYGVSLHAFARRIKEFAIRSALGANPARLFNQILGEACIVAVVGVAGGVLSSAILLRLTSRLAFGASATDARVVWLGPLFFLLVCVLASTPAALRARSLDPARILRAG